MGWFDRAKNTLSERQGPEGAGLQGRRHLPWVPTAPEAASGHLLLSRGLLSFAGATQAMRPSKRRTVEFDLAVSDLNEIDFKDGDELRKAPKGYLALSFWRPGYGSKPKNLLTDAKLVGLLTVSFRDRHGDDHHLAFVNKGDAQMSFQRPTRVTAQGERDAAFAPGEVADLKPGRLAAPTVTAVRRL